MPFSAPLQAEYTQIFLGDNNIHRYVRFDMLTEIHSCMLLYFIELSIQLSSPNQIQEVDIASKVECRFYHFQFLI